MSCATVPGANCAAADANTPSQLAFAGGAAPAEDAPTRARALAPVAARSVSFRIRLPSVGVKRRYHGVWDLKWVQTCPVAVRLERRTATAPPVHGNQGDPGAAADYLDTMPMSKDALIQQLSSTAGAGFTRAQARYAVSKVY